jgi:hypothetical protein
MPANFILMSVISIRILIIHETPEPYPANSYYRGQDIKDGKNQ